MPASYMKTDATRRNHNEHVFGWTLLPATHDRRPSLPKTRRWHKETRALWRVLWGKPQAAMWDASGSSLWAYITLWDDVNTGAATIAQVSAELRQIEALHGLSPKSLLQLKWRLPNAESAAESAILATAQNEADVASLDQRRRVSARLAASTAEGGAA